MLCLELWALVLFLAHVARADYYIDNANTSIAFSYAPNTNGAGWKAFGIGIQALGFSIPNGTTTVNITVDATQLPRANSCSTVGECGSVENCRVWIPFVGSGITMYVVNAGTVGASASFSVDNGQPVTNTLKAPSPPNYQQYNVSMFSVNSLPTGYHSLVMTILEWNGQSSWMMFDYALVNETLVMNSTSTGPSSPTSSSSGSSKINVGAVVAGTLAGIAGVAALTFGVLYIRKRRREVARSEDRAQVTPFMSGHSANDATFLGPGRRFVPHAEDTGSPSPSVRAAILREALATGSDPGSIPSGMTSNVSRPLPTPPCVDMSSPSAVHMQQGLSSEDMKLLERLHLNNAPTETIARVAESLAWHNSRGMSDTSGGAGLMRAGSLMSAAPPPSYQTGH
ncbi:hypothetical protein F5I97DRAFT_1800304 [Phlebopus sp. FC_14]|nr:hypothetical protein F5I97DRAFT_1800304 [Phlebopus sp. FC_14]